MPAVVIDDPLRVACVFSGGARATARVGETANPALARELLVGLAGLVHPHGRVDTKKTVTHYVYALRTLVSALAERGHTGGAAKLTRPRLAGFWWSTDGATEAMTRHMLAALDAETGVLRAEVRELVRGRAYNSRRSRDKRPLPPYTEGEWGRLQDTCRTVITTSYAAHRQAVTAAERGQDPYVHGWSPPNVCWLLVRHGPSTTHSLGAPPGLTSGQAWWRFGATVHRQTAVLFPGTDTVIGYRLLFGALTGVVPDGIAGLGVHDLDWAGDATVLLDYLKARTAAESLTLNRRAVRLLEQWLEHSAALRRFAPPARRDALWLRHAAGGRGPCEAGTVDSATVQRWVKRHGLLADDGQPLPIHRHRIRTTFESHRDRRAWFGSGRATIDPNHSAAVEGDHYLTVSTAAQRDNIDTIIAGAQADLLRKAHPAAVKEPRLAMPATTDRGGTPLVVIVVAITGLLSTVGAAALGGYWANRSVERQFSSQRTAQIQDQRRIVYADFLRATTQVCDALQTNNDTQIQKTQVEVLNQQGTVLLISSPNLRDPLNKLVEYVVSVKGCDNDPFLALRTAFIDAARQEFG